MRTTELVICLVLAAGFCARPAAAQGPAPPVPNRILAEVFSRGDRGAIVCLLYNTAAAFPHEERAARRAAAVPRGGRAVCAFDGVAPGVYAVIAFHDQNGNGRLDRNFLGIPSEGVGASNDARGTFGPPSFDSARFAHPGGGSTVTARIHLNYL